jgi:hypothetical protein
MAVETRVRSLLKTVVWRVVATANSYLVLVSDFCQTNIESAVLMNITGFFIFYAHERVWAHIK